MKNVLDFGVVADNATINTRALQALLNAGGDEIFIPATAPIITGPLTIPPNTRLIIDGYLKLAPGSNTHLLTLGGSNIRIEGLGTLDGNRSQQVQWGGTPGQSKQQFSAAIFYGNLVGFPAVNQPGPSITNIIIEGLDITETENWAISLGNVTRGRLRDIKAFDCGNTLQFTVGCLDCVADGLTISNMDDIAFAFYGGTNGCSIVNSYIYGNPAAAISVLMDQGAPYPCGTTLIANNWCQSCMAGIWVGKNADNFNTTEPHICVSIIGNQCWANQQNGIRVANTADGVVGNNLCAPGNGLGGLLIDPTCSNVRDFGNIVQ